MDIPTSGANNPNSWLLLNDHPIIFQAESENAACAAREYDRNKIRPTATTPDDIEIFIDQKKLETEVKGRWDWHPAGYAGLYELTIRAAHCPPYHTQIRVFPDKLTVARYDRMKADISVFAVDLLFQLHSEAVEKVDFIQRLQETSPLHDYRQIKTIMNQLQNTFAKIRSNPHVLLRKQQKIQDWHQVHQFSNANYPITIGGMIKIPQHSASTVQKNTITHLPQKWRVQQNIRTYDIHENRLLKQFLQQLIVRLRIIEDRAQNEIERRKKQYTINRQKGWENHENEAIEQLNNAIIDCERMKQTCVIWSYERFLLHVSEVAYASKATQVLLKHPHYGQFYQLYLQLQKQFKLRLDTDCYITQLAMRKVSDLYEIWSVFQVTSMIINDLRANGYIFKSETLFYELEKNYFQFDVRKNYASIVLEKEDVYVEIKYEPYYPNYRSGNGRAAIVSTIDNYDPQTPDLVVEIYEKGIPKHIMVFDAKYRWHKTGTDYRPKNEDIDKMRRYLHQIQYHKAQSNTKAADYYRQRNFTNEDIVISSYAIYPGTILYEEPRNNRVGALPISPDMPTAQSNKVRERLNDLLCQASLVD